jgi:cytochrome c oxidase assembly protein subunit 15
VDVSSVRRAVLPPRPSLGLTALAYAAAVALFAVVVLGFLDTATHSALGCGRSFPLCHGQLFPQDNLQAMVEWTHRAVSGVVGVVVLAAALWAAIRLGAQPEVRVLAAVAVGFLLLESVLGALAVLNAEPKALIATHMGVALTALAATFLLAATVGEMRRRGRVERAPVPASIRGWAVGAMAFFYVAVYVGAYVAETGDGAACLTWPMCPGGWIPASGAAQVDMVHRLVAVLAVALGAVLVGKVRPVRLVRPDLYRQAWTILVLLFAQVVSGLVLMLTRIALETTLVHVALATLTFTAAARFLLGTLPQASVSQKEPATQSLPAAAP